MTASYASIAGSEKGRVVTVEFANSGTDSDIAVLGDYRPLALIVPASFEGTSFTFKAGIAADALYAVYDTSGSALSVTYDDSRFIPLDPADFAGMPVIQLIAGTAQTGANSIQIVCHLL